ncbi:MAG: ATP-binding cassette domain-containing protein [Planctomycetia bacterium]|nr:ATP-binding cassette domain-containing protein [Planctomycetia bacterium]
MENTPERSLKKIREQNSSSVLSDLLNQSHQETLNDSVKEINPKDHDKRKEARTAERIKEPHTDKESAIPAESEPSSAPGSDPNPASDSPKEKIRELVRQLTDGPKTPIRSADGHYERLSDSSDTLPNSESFLSDLSPEKRSEKNGDPPHPQTTSPEVAENLRSRESALPKREPRVLPDDSPILLEVRDLCKGYIKAKKLIPVLQGISIQIKQGEFLAVVGQSGSGKSTLLHLMGTLDRPDSGTICFDGQRTDNLPASKRDFIRNHYIGMIFQFYHLIPEMTTLENVIAPLMIRDSILGYFRNRSKYRKQAAELLDLVGLSHRLKHRPNELSGGEMQRASIARALITDPRVLLADEPTGNLDSKTSLGITRLLQDLNREKGLTVVMVTHDMSQTEGTDRIIRLVDGQIAD